ncbi:macro domain-containing protein [Flavobacterium collinsii]|uniref:macro domain-containing protein n=1 Tax=Flavobacterium collinsii TaxID=1114861 RepID=UPI003756FD2F
MKYILNSILSTAYWRYIFSFEGLKSIFAIFGTIWLIAETLDFFKVYTRDQYGSYAFFIFMVLSVIFSILLKRPIKSISVSFPEYDFSIDVRIADLFSLSGATMISTNTQFEADVAGGRIAVDSLQGQFTAKYFTGNQIELIKNLQEKLAALNTTTPYPIGTTIPIHTHGKTFYFTAMSTLGEGGNASSTISEIEVSLNGLWDYVRNSGQLQELIVPVIGTGRGRVKISRKKMIALIAESFAKASLQHKFSSKLIIAVRPEDAQNFGMNLYDIKDHLVHVLK